MPKLSKKQTERMARLNIDLNAILEQSAKDEYIDSGDALELIQRAERLTTEILWGAKCES